MNRTRVLFRAIVGIALLIVIAAAITRNNGGAGPGTATATAAPLPRGTVKVTLASSNTKKVWLDQVVKGFNAARQKTAAGNAIVVEVSHVTSGASMNAILAGTLQPVAWSPGDPSWVEQANTAWAREHGNRPLASQTCPATIFAPLGFAMWRPMAEALGWPDKPIGWDTMVALAADPDGWASKGRPEWGRFTFGHTHPAYANSGLLSMTTFVYGIAGKQDTLTVADVYAPQVKDAMQLLEQNTAKYGREAPAILDLMARQGTSYLHAAAVPEADAVRFNVERGAELSFPLAFIFPSAGTIWADHPYCVLDNAPWVTPEQAEAAGIFRSYLLAREQQEMAIDSYLRPLDRTIALHAPLDLAHGTDPRVSPATIPALPSPNADISAAVIDLFKITKRKATIYVAIDVSGSMSGAKIQSARTATAEFLRRLDPEDRVGALIFSNRVTVLQAPQRAGDVGEGLAQRVLGLTSGGSTTLHDAVCQASRALEDQRRADRAAGAARLYGVILLSDGRDTASTVTENQMFATCLPSNAETDGIKLFPIAFGSDADKDTLGRMASATGGRLYTADPGSISDVYLSISAEQ